MTVLEFCGFKSGEHRVHQEKYDLKSVTFSNRGVKSLDFHKS
jgi:hypothetical protein